MKRVLAATGKEKLSQRERSIVVDIFAARAWTGETLWKMGLPTTGKCIYCGQTDTIFHRAFLCPHFAETREEVVPKDILQLANGLGPEHLATTRLWTPKPGSEFDQHRSALGVFSYQIDGVESRPFGFE